MASARPILAFLTVPHFLQFLEANPGIRTFRYIRTPLELFIQNDNWSPPAETSLSYRSRIRPKSSLTRMTVIIQRPLQPLPPPPQAQITMEFLHWMMKREIPRMDEIIFDSIFERGDGTPRVGMRVHTEFEFARFGNHLMLQPLAAFPQLKEIEVYVSWPAYPKDVQKLTLTDIHNPSYPLTKNRLAMLISEVLVEWHYNVCHDEDDSYEVDPDYHDLQFIPDHYNQNAMCPSGVTILDIRLYAMRHIGANQFEAVLHHVYEKDV